MFKILSSIKCSCPSAAELKAFDEGRVSDGQFSNISSHLESCEKCLAVLVRFNETSGNKKVAARSPYLAEADFTRFAYHVSQLTVFTEEITASSSVASKQDHPNERFLPDELGRYKVVKSLGYGSFGEVYLAEDTLLGRQVAIKAPRVSEFAVLTSIDGFLEEARTTAALEHPNIVPIYDILLIETDRALIVMKYIEGSTLASLLKSITLPIERAVELVREIARAIHYAHEHGFVHRDLKPSNILVDNNNQVHISDFGLGICLSDLQGDQVIHGGSPPYMAPEQVRREIWAIDRRTDVWSLGVMLSELVYGDRPFTGENREQLYASILYDAPRIPSNSGGSSLTYIIRRCLEKDPNNRPQSAAELENDLSAWQQKHFPSPLERRSRRWRNALAFAAISIAIVSLVTALAVRTTNKLHESKNVVEALRTCQPASVPHVIQRLQASSDYSKKILRDTYEETISQMERFRVLCGLASLGDVRPSELLDFVSRLPQEEFPILVSAIAIDNTKSLQVLREQIQLFEGVKPVDAKLRITAMELGAPQYLWQMSKFGSNPTSHYQLRAIWQRFHGSVQCLQSRIASSEVDDFTMLATYILGSMFSDASTHDRSRIRETLIDLYTSHHSSKVHSCAAWALKTNGLGLPPQRGERHPSNEWISLPQSRGDDFCLVRLPKMQPHADTGVGSEESNLYISTTEVSNAIYAEFDPAHQSGIKARYGNEFGVPSGDSVRFVSALSAMKFCNWLSERYALQKCYTGLEGVPENNFKINRDANGFRLPDEEEWIHANLAMSRFGYFFGDDDNQVSLHAQISSIEDTTRQMRFPPNGFGVFDTLGNVSEFCHDPTKPDSITVFGGSLYSLPLECRTESKLVRDLNFDSVVVGFRVVSRFK